MSFAGCCLLSLVWTLVGTLVTDDQSAAIVQSGDGAQQVVRPGELLGRCTIESIGRNHLMLACASGPKRMPLQSASPDEAALVRAAPIVPDPRLFALSAGSFFAMLADRQGLAAQISLEPAVVDGYVYGYRVATLDPAGELAGYGIAAGDVITHVNGASASEAGTFIQTIDALAGQKAFSLQIERDGARISHDYMLVNDWSD